MEDSGIDSDSKTLLFGSRAAVPVSCDQEAEPPKLDSFDSSHQSGPETGEDAICFKGTYRPIPNFKSTSLLQKRLEKQIVQAKRFRLKEQNLDGTLPKKLIPRNRLNVPKTQTPAAFKSDSHPLVTWGSDSDDEFDYHPISKSSAKEISEQLLKDGYNLDLTPDDEDLDLMPPPKPSLSHRCVCCNLNCMCLIQ